VIAYAKPRQTPEEKRLERLGGWLAKGRLDTAVYNELVHALDGGRGAPLKALVERLLDDPATSAKALVGAWRGALRGDVDPPPPPPPPPPPEKEEPSWQRNWNAALNWRGVFAQQRSDAPAPPGGLWQAIRWPVTLVIFSVVGMVAGFAEIVGGDEASGQQTVLGSIALLFGGGLWGAVALIRYLGGKARSN